MSLGASSLGISGVARRHLEVLACSDATVEQRLRAIRSLRGHSPEIDREMDDFLVAEIERLKVEVERLGSTHAELRRIVEKITTPPWFPATLLSVTTKLRSTPSAFVQQGGTRRLVTIADEVEPSELAPGARVLLNADLNLLVGEMSDIVPEGGEVASFDRKTADGRVVLKWRDDTVIALSAAKVTAAQLSNGDLVRWDPSTSVALEPVESSKGDGLFLEENLGVAEGFDKIGGLDDEVRRIREWVELRHRHPEAAQRYGITGGGGILIAGPPGNGKTMLARATARLVGEMSPSGRSRFINIKPNSLGSMWHSASERNVRETFRCAREVAAAEPSVPVVMFFDEIDATGSARGESLSRVDDRVLQALMVEIDGLQARGNLLLMAATNRIDALDPALLRPGRLGDEIIRVRRPRRAAARQIFLKHLNSIPVAVNGDGADPEAIRGSMVESVLSRLFSANGTGELAVLTFRDGSRHAVRAKDLISGAVIAQIVAQAARAACLREIAAGASGLNNGDLQETAGREMAKVAAVLTPQNCHRHLNDLPQKEVVGIELIERGAVSAVQLTRIG